MLSDWGFPTRAMCQVSSTQLRDDLLSMLVAGHETTGSVLTWTAYLMAKVTPGTSFTRGSHTPTPSEGRGEVYSF